MERKRWHEVRTYEDDFEDPLPTSHDEESVEESVRRSLRKRDEGRAPLDFNDHERGFVRGYN
jgi:hypothetical protein